ncbi:MAG TPA: glycoside hydrolase family 97 catalytic domain-containing protein [Vicinamibacterales bacterium]|nr:glycoside hydrolase family 97 catalytic domain-containing protein [Vicinamibacterales bacterium]
MVRLAIALSLLHVTPAFAQQWTVNSPDNRTAITLTCSGGGQLLWRVTRRGGLILGESPLGIRRTDQTFVDGVTFVNATDVKNIDEQYTTLDGKRREHQVRGRERTVTFANPGGARLEIVLRAHNDGVAFRYRFPDFAGTGGERKTVSEELTGFRVPSGSTGWLQPHQVVHRYGPAYEEFYDEVRAGTPAPRPDGWSYPALFHTPNGVWVLISESGFDGTYCGSHLAPNSTGGLYRVIFPDAKEGMGVGDARPTSTIPWTLPWRVVIVGDRAGDILESDLVNDLAPPARMKDTSWIKPGRAAWSWWWESDSPKHAERLNAFTDLAADMGWEYALVDANWNLMETGTIDDVVKHAREKNVGLLLWYNSGGPHNDVTEAPRDRMLVRDVRRAEFTKIREWGVKGVKVDFWHSDKQDRYRQYREILEDAAEFKLLVNFHGSTIPRGWEREFPHLIGMEAVLGAEQYKFREAFSTRAASHNTILPFTRNVVGVMDYTPVTFSDHKVKHTTTNAHELALSVVFTTGVQHFADSVQAYESLPPEPKDFLKTVPVVWDETRVLSGEPGKSVVVARRSGNDWYVAGLNADAVETVRVSLNFLKAGSYQLTLIRDGAEDRAFDSSSRMVTSRDIVEVAMRPRGGFVMRLRAATASAGISTWVSVGADGHLQYRTDDRGNRIMDFSHAGYKGGGVRLPSVRVAERLVPAAGDNTKRIQDAIDGVSQLTPDAAGLRGAVLLQPGIYDVSGSLRIAASGVVLRGSGSGDDGTTIRLTGSPHRLIDIGGSGSWQAEGTAAHVTDGYVPAGARVLTVDSTAAFSVGDSILIQRPVTDAWIHFMGMDALVRDGKPQTWIKAGTLINTDRVVTAIDGARITLDVPLSDSLDATYLNPPGTTVVKYRFPTRIEQVGLESLRVIAPAQDKPISESQYMLLRMNAVSDAWVRDVVSVDTQNSTTFGPTVRRVTVEDVHIRHTLPFTAPAAPADFSLSGTELLVSRSSVTGKGVWPVVTQAGVTGPNVILAFKSDTSGVAPHQRWATGLLVDSSEFTGGTEGRPNVAFSNREYAGSGHGWSVGWAVAWNVKTDYVLIQQPPGAKNWCIGCTGKPTSLLWNGNRVARPQIPSDTFEAPGIAVTPASLYLAQLRDRLGESALANIGYG